MGQVSIKNEKQNFTGRRLLLGLVAGALMFVTSIEAFQGRGSDHSAYFTSNDEPSVKTLSASQETAVALARTEGIDVKIRSEVGSHFVITGKRLGQQQSFSGGKGLRSANLGDYAVDAVATLDNLSGVLSIKDAANEFAARKVESDSLGSKHVRMNQFYKGLRVIGADVIVHFDKSDTVYAVNGAYVPNVNIDVVPSISSNDAETYARSDLKKLGFEEATLVREPVLVVFAHKSQPRLAYELTLASVSSKGIFGDWRYWIDAQTSELVTRYNDVKDVAAPTSNGGNITISGNILAGEGGGVLGVTGWRENNGLHYLYNKNSLWYIYNVSTSASYTDSDTYAYRTSASWGTSDTTEMSAAINFDRTQNYFSTVHGRNSYDNAGAYARCNVHEGVNYVNAFWRPSAQQFFFGDGDGVTADSLVTTDISGHEFSHAVTEYTADLIYSYESGALNESFSDIFGACVEFYSQPDGRSHYPSAVAGTADWLCGEDCWLTSTALRDMRNPRNTATVGSGNEQPSRYKGSYWHTAASDNGGVHVNSGVQNFFFYLLCEGGSGNNDGITYNVTGIGVANAEQIAYRALSVYCTAATDYHDAREAWFLAASDLNPAWVASVEAAWEACGIGALKVTPTEPLKSAGKSGGPFSPLTQSYTLKNNGSIPLLWTASSSQSWLQISPTNGVISVGGSTAANVTITGAARALAAGAFDATVTFQTMGSSLLDQRTFSLLIDRPDYYTELFSSADFDLDGYSLTFTPDGSSSHYSATAKPISSLPVDPSSHSTIPLGDDDSYQTPILSGGQTVKLYGASYNRFYINSNGSISFSSTDTAFSESISGHFSQPRISPFFDDLDPSSAGAIRFGLPGDRAVVSYVAVPGYGMTSDNTFQVEMFFDGRIRLSWLGIAETDGLAGLSAGGGEPVSFIESDLSSFTTDYDVDGMPNWWELQHFGNETNTLPGVDSDGDGFSNLEEYIAGTIPDNDQSFLQITDQVIDVSGTNYVVEWAAVTGRFYSVWRNRDLVGGSEEELAFWLQHPQNSYTDSVDSVESDGFYRVKVEMP